MTMTQAGITYDALYNMGQDEVKVFQWPLIGKIYIIKTTEQHTDDLNHGYGVWFPQQFPQEDLNVFTYKYGTQYFLNTIRLIINQMVDLIKSNKSVTKLTNGWVYNNTYYGDVLDILGSMGG